jgi:hypothetical protein
MRIFSYEVHGDDLDLSDDAQLGDTFAIVGSARVIGLEEQIVNFASFGGKEALPSPTEIRATIQLIVRKADR